MFLVMYRLVFWAKKCSSWKEKEKEMWAQSIQKWSSIIQGKVEGKSPQLETSVEKEIIE